MNEVVLVIIFALTILWAFSRLFNGPMPVTASSKAPPKLPDISPEATVLKQKLKILSDDATVTVAAEEVLIDSLRTLNESALPALCLLCDIAKVVIMFHISCDALEEDIKGHVIPALVKATEASRFPLGAHRCIYYTTGVGKKAVIRQLVPHLHIDADDAFCKDVAPFIPRSCVVNNNCEPGERGAMIHVVKLADILEK